MSKAVSYDHFCKRYNLEVSAQKSRNEYKSYCDSLNVVNSAFAEKTTNEALAKAKAEIK